jgi:prepilin-type N-terminal cleavage/methylation domain-containing protein
MHPIHSTRRDRHAPDAGFTLIELLVVIAIIGILSAIAIQAMSRYRQQAYDATAMHDLANAVKAEEAYYATNQTYVPFGGLGPLVISVPQTVISGTVTLDMQAADQSFEGTASSNRGSGRTFRYNSLTHTYISE